ncbi:MAG: 5'-methylthioadenosine/S-adenosylhomocysteine nucleosidase [Clostridium sp. 27_14]|jgi:MTA/SAH nucleosidase|nr:MAG: 5'-methylthioadenosine/S-adenosylhomocysteine nucleosidase [Clostridium sp. 27_14]
MKIGIIAAEQEEFEAILNIAKVEERKEIYELNFVKCKIKDKICVLVKSGVGKVNAARATQILIDNFKPDYIVNVGVAGGLNPMLSIGDIVIGETLVQHDFDITAFGHAKGYIPGVGEKIYADDYLVKKIEEAIGNQEEKVYKYEKGVIASGDIFCTAIPMRDKIYAKFNAECVEMEGAAIGQVCSLCNVPFVVIRSISDTPNGENEVTYEKFIKLASERCANILKDFVKTIE